MYLSSMKISSYIFDQIMGSWPPWLLLFSGSFEYWVSGHIHAAVSPNKAFVVVVTHHWQGKLHVFMDSLPMLWLMRGWQYRVEMCSIGYVLMGKQMETMWLLAITILVLQMQQTLLSWYCDSEFWQLSKHVLGNSNIMWQGVCVCGYFLCLIAGSIVVVILFGAIHVSVDYWSWIPV